MSGKLRLEPLPKAETVRLTIALPASSKADLDRYAELYAHAYGEPVEPAALAAQMIATFMERDREFRKTRGRSHSGERASSSTTSTTVDASSARETP